MINRLRYLLELLRLKLKWRVVVPAVVAISKRKGERFSSTSALLVYYGLIDEHERLDRQDECTCGHVRGQHVDGECVGFTYSSARVYRCLCRGFQNKAN